MEWLEESITKSTREIQSNSVAETEQILERHEKNLDQLDKKKKVFMDQKGKGEKLLNDPKAPKFLNGHMERLVGLWKEANNKGEDRLEDLKNNLVAWEAYENKRNQLDGQLNEVSFVLLFFYRLLRRSNSCDFAKNKYDEVVQVWHKKTSLSVVSKLIYYAMVPPTFLLYQAD